MKKIGLIILLIATLLTPSLLAYSTLDSEPANTDCPGVSISELENVSSYKLILADMSMNANYDGDKLSFTPAVAGTLKVSINADQPTSLRLGTTCGHQEYDYMVNKTSYEKSIEIPANGPVHIMAYNWSTGAGYDYSLNIEFTPEGVEAPVEDETTPDNSTATSSELDSEPANTDCPGVIISELNNISTHKLISADMSMNAGYDGDKLSFTPAVAGTLRVAITSDQLINLRLGTTCGFQEYDYMVNKTSDEKSIEIPANTPVHIMAYNWSTGAGYDYHLDIEFTPEGGTDPVDPNDSTTDTGDNSNTDEPAEDTTDPSTTTSSELDREPANTDCPGVTISELENVSTHKLISADMSMNAGYDGDKLSFTPAVAGTLRVAITSDQLINLRLGTTCGFQEYDYMVNKTSYEKSIEIPANAAVHIMVYNWSTGAGYDYQLDIEFTPEGITDPVDPNDSTTDTGDNSNTGDSSNTNTPEEDTNTDYTSQNFTENSAGSLTHPTLTNEVIGTTKGSFSVNQGAANYSLDISVPAGRGGMQPKISLDYNSNGGDGYLGKGWGIGGLGVISRCPSTKAVDKEIVGVKLNGDDKYCLNGQRLIKIDSNPPEGDAEYRTEIDSYAKVVSYGSNDFGPAHWKVWTKSGLIYRYGYNDDADIKVGTLTSIPANTATKGSRAISVTGEERILSWAVDKISDRTEDGNSINFHYNNYPENERYITRIDYVGGAIDFKYDLSNRKKEIKGFMSGYEYQVTQRLDQIIVLDAKERGTKIRSYDIGYLDNTDLLENITEYAGNEDLETLHFDWTSTVASSIFETNPSIITNLIEDGNRDGYGNNDHDNWPYIYYPDLNSDGISDMCYRSDQGIKCYFNKNGSGFGSAPDIDTTICKNGDSQYGNCNDSDNYATIRFVDITGDAKPDLVYRSDHGMRVWKNQGNSFTKLHSSDVLRNDWNVYGDDDGDNWPYIYYPDINNDGLTDMCYRSDRGIKCFFNKSGTGFSTRADIDTTICKNGDSQFGNCNGGDNYDTIRFIDIDGDSQSDIFYRSDQGVRVWRNTGNKSFEKFYSSDLVENYTNGNSGDNYYSIRHADINGDGLSDMCYRSDTGIKCYLNDGTGYKKESEISTYICQNYDGTCYHEQNRDTLQLLDINGDSKSDLIYRDNTGIKTLLSNGNGFTSNQSLSILKSGRGLYNVGTVDRNNINTLNFPDINGDGTPDLTYRTDGRGVIFYKNSSKRSFINRIYNGINAFIPVDQEIAITYKPLTDKTIYTKGSSSGNNIALTPPMHVVTSVKSDNGLGGTNTLSYSYEDYKINRLRGSLGFRKIESLNDTNNIKTITTYKQNFPYIGMLEQSYTYVNGTHTAKQSLIYDKIVESVNGKYIYHPYTDTSTTDDYLTNITTEVDNEVDKYGNMKSIVQTTTGDGKTHTTTTTNTYASAAQDEDNWIIGRLTHTRVKHENGIDDAIIKSSGFTYYPTTGMLKTETVEPGSTNTLTKSYIYDQFGNKIEEIISGTDITHDIKTSYEYDENKHDARFPMSITNAKNQTEHRTYTSKGEVASITDPNDQTIRFKYDEMGKKIRETTPYGTTYIRHTMDRGTHKSLYSVTTYGSNTPLSKVYYDKFARVVHSTKEDMNKNKISTSKIYNAKGELEKEILPTGKTIKYYYDNYGRQTSVVKPNPSGSGDITDTVSYSGLKTTQTTDNIQKVTEKNTLGKVIKVTDGANSSNANEKSTISYKYYPDGALKSTTDSGGNTITMKYDSLGYKSEMTDPDMGTWKYTNNALGKVTKTVDAKNQTTYLIYDTLGRMTAKHEQNGYAYFWIWDARKVGAVAKEWKVSGSTHLYNKDYFYKNNKQELIRTVEAFDDAINDDAYTTQMSYHANGKLRDLTYPNGLTVRHNYTNGYLKSIQDGTNTNGKMVYKVTQTDHLGRVTESLLENGITTSYGYNGTGLLNSAIGKIGSLQKTNLSYTYDNRGNVKTKTDALIGYHNNNVTGLTETYTYDGLNRIKDVQVDAAELSSNDRLRYYHYDNLGNLTNKNGLTLNYSTNYIRPHAVQSTNDGRSYTYDANGNMTSDGRKNITYNHANKPITIKKIGANENTTSFLYGSSGNRYLKTFGNNGMSKTHYVGKLFERTHPTNNGNYIDKNFIYFGGKLIKIKEKSYSGILEPIIVKESYIHQDNLGNVIALTDKTGKVLNRRSYTPFGEIRPLMYKEATQEIKDNITKPTEYIKLALSSTNRAFTGHESIEGTDGLIHMNGRVYDSSIGRFLSADPFIQAPYNSQSYNRYTYVMNNPLNLIDPNGYWSIDLGVVKIGNHGTSNGFVTRAVLKSPILQGIGYVVAMFYGGPAGAGAYSAFLTKASGGSWGDAIKSGVISGAIAWASAEIANGIGNQFGHDTSFLTAKTGIQYANAVMKATAHGLSQTGIQKLRTGTGKGAFLSGFITSGFSVGDKGYGGVETRTVIMMVVGGTASEIGGGKFANGAVTAAFVHLYNTENVFDNATINKFNDAKMKEFAELDPQTINKRAVQGFDDGAKMFGRIGISLWSINTPYTKFAGILSFGTSSVLDGFKHFTKMYMGTFDSAELVIDYAIPYSVKPYGPAVGEGFSQVMEEGYNYANENLR